MSRQKQIVFFVDDNTFHIYDHTYQVDLFKQDYLSSDQTRQDFATKYNITDGMLKKILSHYNIARPVIKLRFIDQHSFLINGVVYSVDDLVQQYITNNMPMSYFMEQWKISSTTFGKIISHYEIMKDPYERVKNGAKTNMAKYGVKWFTQTQEMQQKSQETLMNRYGVTNIRYSDSVQNKVKQTNLKRYNTEYAIASPEVREKIKQTNLSRYGVESTLQVSECKEKIKQTNLLRYGAETPLASMQIQEKIKQSNKLKYGCEHAIQRDILHYDIWNDDLQFAQYLCSGEAKTYWELSDFFNVDEAAIWRKACKLNIGDKIKRVHGYSRYEEEICDIFVNDFGIADENIVKHDRQTLSGMEIDIYLPQYKFGIEFNGDYWHSDIFKTDHSGRSTYHQEKSLLADKNGIFLFHIFEYEWATPSVKSNIINRLRTILLKNNIKIGARKCKIIELTKKQKSQFLDINHIQGNDHSSKQYGLVYNNEIVSCMTFVHPKNNKYTWELSRFCNKNGYIVQGGASKLFQNFVQSLNIGDTISSYNDITKTKGDLYNLLGFKCVSVNDPNYVWINFSTGDIRTRYQEQQKGERERMQKSGYHRICDCGTKTWVYTVVR